MVHRSLSIVGRPQPESLTRLTISSTPLLDDDDDGVTSFHPLPPILQHRHNDSISWIEMRDPPPPPNYTLLSPPSMLSADCSTTPLQILLTSEISLPTVLHSLPPSTKCQGGSGSSLDLHTSLPHLMVKDGLLSPHSKLFTRLEDGENRPEGIMSMAITSGILKDERNTPMRKERHRW